MSYRTCAFAGCDARLSKKPGPGRWPKWCPDHRGGVDRAKVVAGPTLKVLCAGGCGELMRLTRSSADSPMCHPCRRAANPCPFGSNFKYGCRCEFCVAAQNARVKEYYRKRAAEGNPVGPHELRCCEGCGAEFQARVRPGRTCRFCSISCANATLNKAKSKARRTSLPKKSAVRRRAERRAAKAAAGSSGGNRVWVQGDCLVCGEPFPPSPGAQSRYCSRDCRSVARSGAKWVSFEDRLRVYRRDNWVCQLCGNPMSRAYSRDDDWSPTLDHIIPRSRGGSDDLGNLRSAHMWCNAARGNESEFSVPVEVLEAVFA